MLVLQLAGPSACPNPGASHASADLTGLSQALGQQTAICHHGEPDGPSTPDDGTCCACMFCHLASNCAPPPPVVFGPAAPAVFARIARDVTRSVGPIKARFIEAAGPRGPPLGI